MQKIEHRLIQIKDTISYSNPQISFEFFPPRSEVALENLKETIISLEKLNPEYVSVTYGAGGSTKDATYELVKYIKENTSLNPAAHLTCVNATKEQVNKLARSYLDIDVKHIVALRGDVPGGGAYTPSSEGYAYADDLVAGLKEVGDFDISVAAYPEVHPQALSPEADLEHLKRKMDAGANQAITQYCFDTDKIIDFITRAKNLGVNDITPGIVIMNRFDQLISFSKRCGAEIPNWMYQIFDGLDETPASRDAAAAYIAVEQCRLLMQHGINKFHFYTLNRYDLTASICHLLGVNNATKNS
jgi:methylenetetrahydrofolate reductase (NADPH)